MKNLILWLFRLIVGGMFIFSGIVKANDPLGLSYKTQEFFEKMHLDGLHDYTLVLSIIMIILEIVAGITIIIGYRSRITTIVLLGLILFFTYLTAFALFKKGPDGLPIIKECGCFGDCFKLTNEQTFTKDILLLALILILVIFHNSIKPILGNTFNLIIIYGSILLALWGQVYVLGHLPFHDCLPYKVGANIKDKMTGSGDEVYKILFTYEKNGTKQIFDETNLPDSTWTYVDRKDSLIKPATKQQEIKDFVLNDENGVDNVPAILDHKGKVVLWMIKDWNVLSDDEVKSAKKLIDFTSTNKIQFYIVIAFTRQDKKSFFDMYNLPQHIPVLTLDATAMKTAMRTNSGIMVIENGIIKNKFGQSDIPVKI